MLHHGVTVSFYRDKPTVSVAMFHPSSRNCGERATNFAPGQLTFTVIVCPPGMEK